MDPNNMTAGTPGGQNNNAMPGGAGLGGAPEAAVSETVVNETVMGGTTPAEMVGAAPSEAAVEMQAAMVADQIANPVEPSKENIMAEGNAAKKKSGKGLLFAVVFLVIVALGGIGFGVWAMMDGNNQTKTLNDQIGSLKKTNNELMEQLSEANANANDSGDTIINIDTNGNFIDSDLAQNLISPYISMIGYYNNVFSLGLDEGTKVYIAYVNLGREMFASVGVDNPSVSYNEINNEYKRLFGDNGNIEKKDYQVQNTEFLYKVRNSDGYETFEIVSSGIGGTGTTMFDVVKKAEYDDNAIGVEVYHDTVPGCEANENGGYCVSGIGPAATSINQYNMRDLINNFADRIPVYKMTFVKDGGHYVLSGVEKQ